MLSCQPMLADRLSVRRDADACRLKVGLSTCLLTATHRHLQFRPANAAADGGSDGCDSSASVGCTA